MSRAVLPLALAFAAPTLAGPALGGLGGAATASGASSALSAAAGLAGLSRDGGGDGGGGVVEGDVQPDFTPSISGTALAAGAALAGATLLSKSRKSKDRSLEPAPAAATIDAPPSEIALREQQTKQRVAGSVTRSGNAYDTLGSVKRRAARELLG